jgi:[histone H3]-lysine4 N-trimethyltransferase ASH1L
MSAAARQAVTRTSSTASSALSNIEVAAGAAMEEDSSSSERVSASTPPTSVAETASVGSAKKPALDRIMEEESGGSGRRSRRARASVPNYNLKQLSDAQQPSVPSSAGSSRNVSGLTGQTLVAGQEADVTPSGDKVDKALDMDWELTGAHPSQKKSSAGKMQRRPSVKEKVKKMAGKVGSVLGKRGRGAVETGKRTMLRQQEPESEDDEEVPRWKKELDTGPKGLLDEIDLDAVVDVPAPPAKKQKTSTKAALKEMGQPPAAPVPVAKGPGAGKRMKKWQKEGLYVGQEADADVTQGGKKKLQKKRPTSSASDATAMTDATEPPAKRFMGLPMFNYLEKTRDFVVPFDIFAPSWKKGDEKPKDWHQINKNRPVGDAKGMWGKAEKMAVSHCVCQPSGHPDEPGCDEGCLNRAMQFECNSDNCLLSEEQCGNRAFASLAKRVKKGGAFDVGVEVVKTPNRGFGIRSCRTFAPGQIIMEYTGEIITEGECQRRMREEYKDKQCFYLMELEGGLIIDGTRGSMARFINHSCEPNCEVRMVKVNGVPRMGVFAGNAGICTGEELTYDYNFDNFSKTPQACYCGAPTCRGTLSKRLNATEMKKAAKEEAERRRKAAEAAQKAAEEMERKKQVKTDRGSSWRGWVAIDDPETKERLRQEKKGREEAEKNSARAKRLAARGRRDSAPAEVAEATKEAVKKASPNRRRTTAFEKPSPRKRSREESAVADEDDEKDAIAGAAAPSPKRRATAKGAKHIRTLSTGSKFQEELSRPTSVQSKTSTITRKTEISITETRAEKKKEAAPANAIPAFDGPVDEPPAQKPKPPAAAIPQKKGRASSLVEAARSVGQAVRNGLLGAPAPANKPETAKAEASASAAAPARKWRQSTLSFAKLG